MSWTFFKGRELTRKVREATSRGVQSGAEAIQADVLQEVPLNEGLLSESVLVIPNPNNKLSYAISAGGGNGTGFPVVPYAVRWHENQANFQKGRKHNYVRDPVKRGNKKVRKAIEQELKLVL